MTRISSSAMSRRRPPRGLIVALGLFVATSVGAQTATVFIHGGVVEATDIVILIETQQPNPAGTTWAAQTINGLAPDQSFGLVAYDGTPTTFAPTMLPATPQNQQAAYQWMLGLPPGSGSCLDAAILAAVDLLENSPEPIEVPVIYTRSRGVLCQAETADLIDALGGGVKLWPDLWSVPAVPEYSAMFALHVSSGPEVAHANFLRGDVNSDGVVNIADGIMILQLGFGVVTVPFCRDAADVGGDGILEPISDAVALFAALFVNGAPPVPAPFPACDLEPTPNGLTCYPNDCP